MVYITFFARNNRPNTYVNKIWRLRSRTLCISNWTVYRIVSVFCFPRATFRERVGTRYTPMRSVALNHIVSISVEKMRCYNEKLWHVKVPVKCWLKTPEERIRQQREPPNYTMHHLHHRILHKTSLCLPHFTWSYTCSYHHTAITVIHNRFQSSLI